MDAQAFVAGWKHEKTSYIQMLKHGDLQASQQVAALNLTPTQTEQLWSLLDTVLTDTMYTLLLGLDGAANIGGVQQNFQLNLAKSYPPMASLRQRLLPSSMRTPNNSFKADGSAAA